MDNFFIALITFNTGIITILLSIKVITHFFFDEKIIELEIENEISFNMLIDSIEHSSYPNRESMIDSIRHEEESGKIENYTNVIELMIDALKSLSFDLSTNIRDSENNVNNLYNIIREVKYYYFRTNRSVFEVNEYIKKEKEKEKYSFYDVQNKENLLAELEKQSLIALDKAKEIEIYISNIKKIEVIDKSKIKKKNIKFDYLIVYQFIFGVLLPIFAVGAHYFESFKPIGLIIALFSLFPYSIIAGKMLRHSMTHSRHTKALK